MMNILPLAYLGNIDYFTALCFERCVIDIHEHYVKQSCRTRCEILSANGVSTLIVPVVRPGNFDKKPIKEVRIDYSKRWQHQHWQAIVSAYRSSAYFDFYEDFFRPFYTENRYDLLVDWNLDLLQMVLKLLGSMAEIIISERYIDPLCGDIDLRGAFPSKPALRETGGLFHPKPYHQVFCEKIPFVANLSIIDLLFCEGPGALAFLARGAR